MMQGFSIKDLPCHFPVPTLPPLELLSRYPSPELDSLCIDASLPLEKSGEGGGGGGGVCTQAIIRDLRCLINILIFLHQVPGWKTCA